MTERYRTVLEPEQADVTQVLEEQRLRIERLRGPDSPVATLGDIVLSSLIGGAITGGTLMPRTEAITLEMIVGATEYGDAVHDQKRAA